MDTVTFHWGRWWLDKERLTLTWKQLPGTSLKDDYELDLSGLTSSAQMLDSIMQVTAKSWIGPKDLSDFVDALNNIFDPQATLCSQGRSKRLSRKQVAELVKAVSEEEE